MPECMHTSMGARACRAKLGCEVKECVEAEAEREREKEREREAFIMYQCIMHL